VGRRGPPQGRGGRRAEAPTCRPCPGRVVDGSLARWWSPQQVDHQRPRRRGGTEQQAAMRPGMVARQPGDGGSSVAPARLPAPRRRPTRRGDGARGGRRRAGDVATRAVRLDVDFRPDGGFAERSPGRCCWDSPRSTSPRICGASRASTEALSCFPPRRRAVQQFLRTGAPPVGPHRCLGERSVGCARPAAGSGADPVRSIGQTVDPCGPARHTHPNTELNPVHFRKELL